MVFDLIIVGAGAAGFFAANHVLEQRADARILILEKGSRPLDKVRISGGGRCNVTHACFEPKELVKYYPRGSKELIGPFHKFQPGDTIAWFETKGVELKIESDGRMFPTTDQSATIMEALQKDVLGRGAKMNLSNGVRSFAPSEVGWEVKTNQDVLQTRHLLLAPGSSKPIWQVLEQLGHTIVPPVPSLFTFNCKDERIKDLPGLVAQEATLKIAGSPYEEFGPLLITHWGMSGPGVLKLSARAARFLAEKHYAFEVKINWVSRELEDVYTTLLDQREEQTKWLVQNAALFSLPSRLWKSLCRHAQIDAGTKWGDLNNKKLRRFAEGLTQAILPISGKSTFKDEFVTAGGVELKEVDFKGMESKRFEHLYFAGEILNIDALTGGFNFQAAWTTAFLAAQCIASRL